MREILLIILMQKCDNLHLTKHLIGEMEASTTWHIKTRGYTYAITDHLTDFSQRLTFNELKTFLKI